MRLDVGPQKRAFYVPRRLATSRSTLLAAASQDSQTISLLQHDAQVFSIWLQIILQGHVVIDDEDNVVEKEQLWSLLVQTYLLAIELGDVQSMNITMDDIVRYGQAYSGGWSRTRADFAADVSASIPSKKIP